MRDRIVVEVCTEWKNWDDPVVMLGDDANDFDRFNDWLDIAEEDEDLGLEAYEEVHKRLVKYGREAHAEVVMYRIKKLRKGLVG